MQVAKVGQAAPEFARECADARDDNRRSVRSSDYAGRWLMLVFYPRDFSFVCPTELTSFSGRWMDFQQRNCDLLGVSVDSAELHREWLRTSPAEGGLGPLQFPLASDPDGAMARAYGVWLDEKQVSLRGLFVIDPEGILQYAVVHNLNVGRSPGEVLRVLDALQTGALCPASWTSGTERSTSNEHCNPDASWATIASGRGSAVARLGRSSPLGTCGWNVRWP